jgi:hypothetical protein
MYIGLHVKFPLLLSDFNEIEFSRQVFEKYSNIKFHKLPYSGSRVVPCGRTDMTKLIVALRNFANVHKNDSCSNVNTAIRIYVRVEVQLYTSQTLAVGTGECPYRFTPLVPLYRRPGGLQN